MEAFLPSIGWDILFVDFSLLKLKRKRLRDLTKPVAQKASQRRLCIAEQTQIILCTFSWNTHSREVLIFKKSILLNIFLHFT